MEIAKVLDNNIRFTATEVVSRVAVGDRKSPVIEVKTRQSQQNLVQIFDGTSEDFNGNDYETTLPETIVGLSITSEIVRKWEERLLLLVPWAMEQNLT